MKISRLKSVYFVGNKQTKKYNNKKHCKTEETEAYVEMTSWHAPGRRRHGMVLCPIFAQKYGFMKSSTYTLSTGNLPQLLYN